MEGSGSTTKHETTTPKTFSENYTKTTALERSIASKLPGEGLKDPLLPKEYTILVFI